MISGPGGTLWGANAVNGVINIITRNSRDTEGGELVMGGGNLGGGATVQYGGRLAPDLTYRAYLGDFYTAHSTTSTGASADDSWSRPQGGFRLDWSPAGNLVTLEGDLYRGRENQLGAPDQTILGGDLLGRWRHTFAGGSALQIQAYYDSAGRFVPGGGGGDQLNTFDVDVQHSFALNGWNAIVWGAGERFDTYRVFAEPSLQFNPDAGRLNYANVFVEDTMSITDRVKLFPGIKLEDDAYVGVEPLPSLRASWKITDTNLLWAAVSRAERSPTPFDRDAEGGGSPPLLIGGADFQSEKLIAYEIGYRTEPTPNSSLSISAYYNRYTSLRSIDFTPTFFPVEFANFGHGDTYGVEIWGDWQVNDWWRLSAGINLEHENLTFDVPLTPGFFAPYEAPVVPTIENQIIGYTGDDPAAQGSLRSTIRLLPNLSWQADLRYVGPLPNPAVPGYVELNTSL
ncbi:MAG: TonB-dependent receptor plug domain-containing protein, partial [Stellaceae bacterium]